MCVAWEEVGFMGVRTGYRRMELAAASGGSKQLIEFGKFKVS